MTMRQIDLYELSNYTTEARGLINKIYLHWTAGDYDYTSDRYHINITGDGALYTDMESLTEHKSHTYMRNTGAIGITLCCCYGAVPLYNYGAFPPTKEQKNMLAKVIAKLCIEIGLPINNYTVMTHDEAARNTDGGTTHSDYGIGSGDPETKWDLYGLGDELRAKALYYYSLWSNRVGNATE